MKTSEKKARKRTSKAAPAGRVVSERKSGTVVCCLYPAKAEFFNHPRREGDEPYSRIANGAHGSDASAQVTRTLHQMDKDGVTVILEKFDAQGFKLPP